MVHCFLLCSFCIVVLNVLSLSLGKRLIGLDKWTNSPFIRDHTGSCNWEHKANHTHQITMSHQQCGHRRKMPYCSPKSFCKILQPEASSILQYADDGGHSGPSCGQGTRSQTATSPTLGTQHNLPTGGSHHLRSAH